jgi:2'-5' RNA ligase
MARLFVAVWPPEHVTEELRALHRKDQRGVRFVPPDNWHITLRFLGEEHVDRVVDTLDGLTLPPARARLGPAVDVLDERAVVVPVAGVDELARTVIDSTREIGERPPKRYVAHVTLARVKARVPMPRVLGTIVRAEFDVEEIALVQSRLHPHGARYETLHTWPVPTG